jgi:hypothetical protein
MATGVRQRHGNGCNGKGRCDCPWRAEVYSKRDDRKLRKTFPTQAAAKAWRADKLAAANNGKLRAPTSMTVRQAPCTHVYDRAAGRRGVHGWRS